MEEVKTKKSLLSKYETSMEDVRLGLAWLVGTLVTFGIYALLNELFNPYITKEAETIFSMVFILISIAGGWYVTIYEMNTSNALFAGVNLAYTKNIILSMVISFIIIFFFAHTGMTFVLRDNVAIEDKKNNATIDIQATINELQTRVRKYEGIALGLRKKNFITRADKADAKADKFSLLLIEARNRKAKEEKTIVKNDSNVKSKAKDKAWYYSLMISLFATLVSSIYSFAVSIRDKEENEQIEETIKPINKTESQSETILKFNPPIPKNDTSTMLKKKIVDEVVLSVWTEHWREYGYIENNKPHVSRDRARKLINNGIKDGQFPNDFKISNSQLSEYVNESNQKAREINSRNIEEENRAG